MAEVTVSVILCTNEGGERLYRTVDSIFAQSFVDWELIVVCNGRSRANIYNKLKAKYQQKLVRVLSTPISYLPFSLNLALHEAKGKYIARIDTGDVADENRLKIQTGFLNKRRDIEVVGSNYRSINTEGKIVSNSSLPTSPSDIDRYMRFSNPICHPSVMYRKSVVLALGGYRSQTAAEDFDLWIRISQLGKGKFYNVELPLVSYENLSTNHTRKNILAYISISYSFFEAFLATKRWFYLAGFLVNIVKFVFYGIGKILKI